MRAHLIRVADGKAKEFYGEIKKNGDKTSLALFDSDISKIVKFEYNLKNALPLIGTTATSILLVTPDVRITIVFDTQAEKLSFLKAMSNASWIKKDNDYMNMLMDRMSYSQVFSINSLQM